MKAYALVIAQLLLSPMLVHGLGVQPQAPGLAPRGLLVPKQFLNSSTTSTTSSSSSSSSTDSSTSESTTDTSSTTESSVSTTLSNSVSSTSASTTATSTSTTATSTAASSGSSSTTSSTSSAPSVVATLAIQVVPAVSTKRQRRQNAAEYIGPDGSLVATLAEAAAFGVNANGQLQSSAGGFVATNPGVANSLFVAITGGTISTTFTATPFSWTNAAFTGGAATFCQLGVQIYSVFTSAPAGCVTVTLASVPRPTDAGSATTSANLAVSTPATASNAAASGNGAGSASSVVNNIAFSDNSYHVNGSIYNNSGNVEGSNNDNTDITGNGNIVGTSSGNGSTFVSVGSILPTSVLAAFAANGINYYSTDGVYYYAKFCPTCPIVPVYKQSGGAGGAGGVGGTGGAGGLFIDTNGGIYSIASALSSSQSATPAPGCSAATMGNAVYGSASCVSHCSESCAVCAQGTTTQASPVMANVTTVVACSTCPGGSQTSTITPVLTTITTVSPCSSCAGGSTTATITSAVKTAAGAKGTGSGAVPFTGSAATIQSSAALMLAMLLGVLLLP